VVINAAPAAIDFMLPIWPSCHNWTLLLDTGAPSEGFQDRKPGAKHAAPARSVLVFGGTA